MTDLKFWLGFSLVQGIGPRRLADLIARFGTLEAAWNATESALHETGLGSGAAEQLIQQRRKLDLDAVLQKIQAAGIKLIPLGGKDYPSLLRDIDDPPILLYVRGQLLPQDERAVAVVGTRKPTQYGLDAAYRLAKDLASSGVTIISGLAQGIDAAAHKGALNGGGRTIAVLGSGVDVIYPKQHHTLAQQIAQHGAVISEFPLGVRPLAANFPIRNRIVSGMALGVLVTEAPEGSGALITANIAGDQGREVFAVPANIFNPMGRGTNRLIQDGARLVMSAGDVLDELNVAYDSVKTRDQTNRVMPENQEERHLMAYLQADPIHIDDLVRLSGLSIAQVSSTLTILELKGLAQMVGHMQYCRTT